MKPLEYVINSHTRITPLKRTDNFSLDYVKKLHISMIFLTYVKKIQKYVKTEVRQNMSHSTSKVYFSHEFLF